MNWKLSCFFSLKNLPELLLCTNSVWGWSAKSFEEKKIVKLFTTSHTLCWIIVLNCRQLLWAETWVWLVFTAKYSYMNKKIYYAFSFCLNFVVIVQKSCKVVSTMFWLEQLKLLVVAKLWTYSKYMFPWKVTLTAKKKENGFFSGLHICLSLTKKGHESSQRAFAAFKMQQWQNIQGNVLPKFPNPFPGTYSDYLLRINTVSPS